MARIISDERALFNDQWKLYYKKPVMFSVSGTYSLFNIIEDPYEKNDLSRIETEIFEAMRKTLLEMPERDVIGDMNPAHAYLHGDDAQGGVELGSPWLDGEYEFNDPPSALYSFFIILWILIQAFKYQLTIILLSTGLVIYLFKRK